jgi:alpha-N-acetylglucosaminidase
MKKGIVLAMIVLVAVSSAQSQQAARQLAIRILGNRADQFEFVLRPSDKDLFTLEQHGDKVRIGGNNDNSMAMGLNYYLKEYAMTHVSWYASQPVELPKRLPRVGEPIVRKCEVSTRFFLNYCTYGYTMVWWQWWQWERFIDWMALNGVNMPLALTGQEAVWQEVWREMGMTDDEIRAYFSGPAHLPWHRMANLDGFGGPLPQDWIDGQKELQKKILARERELNMTPVLPAFAGHVPRQIAECNPQADIKQLSSWCGFEPTYFMNSTDSLFAVIQQKYLAKQTALYGTDHIYGVDPFNEMDPPSWEPDYLASVSRNIYSSLQQVDPEAQWLQMSWVFYYKRRQWTPERLRAYLTAVPQGKMVLLDYFCEKTEVWRETDGFYGQPYIWCYLGNFGGNTMLVGNLHELDCELSNAQQDQKGNMMGIGSTLESFDNSPQIFEFLLEHPWNLAPSSKRVGDFTRRWADLRYGKADPYCLAAWQLLVDSVYKDWSFYGLGTQVVARPSLKGHGTYYTKPYYSYNNDHLLQAIRLLLKHPSCRASYQYDIANLLSQWLGNHFMEVRDDFTYAYQCGDMERMLRDRDIALDMIQDADRLLMTVEPLSFWTWTQEARIWGKTEAEQRYYETQARTLLTIWGGPVLNDYANRMWGGLLMHYYHQRWEMFFNAVIDDYTKGAGKRFDEEAFKAHLTQFENDWNGCSWVDHKLTLPFHGDIAQMILRKIDQGRYRVPNRAAEVLGEYMRLYPDAQLQDVYKTCFQDVYGPGHIIKDSASCAQYIINELEQVNTADPRFPDFEYTGVEGNYVRVNLRVIKDGRVPLDLFVRLLMQSADVKKKMPLYDWRGQWDRLTVILDTLTPRPLNFEADAANLRAMLDRGETMVHHSQRFNQAYAPHYRIISRDLFESQLLKLIAVDW